MHNSQNLSLVDYNWNSGPRPDPKGCSLERSPKARKKGGAQVSKNPEVKTPEIIPFDE